MVTLPSSRPATGLSTQLYYQLVSTLSDLLPPPLDDSPEALRTRNHAAIAKVAALLPVNANEIDLAAQCIAARAQAEEVLRLVRQNAGDIVLMMRLNAQYGSMVRTSLSVHGRLMQVQAIRQKREAIKGAASEETRALPLTELSMLKLVNAEAARAAAAPAAFMDGRFEKNVSENGIDSHGAAFETSVSEPPGNRLAKSLDETGQRKVRSKRWPGRGAPGRREPEPPRRPNHRH